MAVLIITQCILVIMIAIVVLRFRRGATWLEMLGDELVMTPVALLLVLFCFSLLMRRSDDGWRERYEKDVATVVDRANIQPLTLPPRQLCSQLQQSCGSEWQQRQFSGTGSLESFSESAKILESDFNHLLAAFQIAVNSKQQSIATTKQVEGMIPEQKSGLFSRVLALFSAKKREQIRQGELKEHLSHERAKQAVEVQWLSERYSGYDKEIRSGLKKASSAIEARQWKTAYRALYAVSQQNKKMRNALVDSVKQKTKAELTFSIIHWGFAIFSLLCCVVQLCLKRCVPNSISSKRLLYPVFVLCSGIGICLMADISLNYLPKLRYIFLYTWGSVIVANILILVVVFFASRPKFHRFLERMMARKFLFWAIYSLMLVLGGVAFAIAPGSAASECIKLLLVLFFAWFAAVRGAYIAGRVKQTGLRNRFRWIVKYLAALFVVLVAIGFGLYRLHDFGPLLLLMILATIYCAVVMGRVPLFWITAGTIFCSGMAYLYRSTLMHVSAFAHIFSRFEEMMAPFSAGSGEISKLIWLRRAAGASGFGWGEIPYWGHMVTSINAPVTPAQIPSDYTSSHIMAQFGYVGGGALLLGVYLWLYILFLGIDVSRADESAKGRFLSWFASLGTLLLLIQLVVTLCGNLAITPLTGITTPLFSYGITSLLLCAIILGINYCVEATPHDMARRSVPNTSPGHKALFRRFSILETCLLVLPVILISVITCRELQWKNQIGVLEEMTTLLKDGASSLQAGSWRPDYPTDFPVFTRIATKEKDKIRLLAALDELDKKLETLADEHRLKRRYYLDLDLLVSKLEQRTDIPGSSLDKAIMAVHSLRVGNRLSQLVWREDLPLINQKGRPIAAVPDALLTQRNPWGAISGEILLASPSAANKYLRLGQDTHEVERPSKLRIIDIRDEYEQFSLAGLEDVLKKDLAIYLNKEKAKGLVQPDNHVKLAGKDVPIGNDVVLTINPELQQKADLILNEELQTGGLATATIAVMDVATGQILVAAAAGSSEHSRKSKLPLVLQETLPASTAKLILSAAILENPALTEANPKLKKYLAAFPYNLKESVTEYFYPLAFEYKMAGAFRDQSIKVGWNSDCVPGDKCRGGIMDYLFGSEKPAGPLTYPIAGRLFVRENPIRLLTDKELENLPAYNALQKANETEKYPTGNARLSYDYGNFVRIAVAGQGNSKTSVFGELLLMSHIVAAANGKENFSQPHLVKTILNSKGEEQPSPPLRNVTPGISAKSAATLVSYLKEVNTSGTGSKGFAKIFGRRPSADEMFIGKTGTTQDSRGTPYSLYVGAFSQQSGGKAFDRILIAIVERKEATERNGAAEIAFRMVKEMRGNGAALYAPAR